MDKVSTRQERIAEVIDELLADLDAAARTQDIPARRLNIDAAIDLYWEKMEELL